MKYIVFSMIALFGFGGVTNAYAQASLTTNTQIDFGTFIINDQSVATTVQVNTDGSFTASADLYHVRDPNPADIRIENVPQGQNVTLTFFDATLTSVSNPTDPTMNITSYTFAPGTLVGQPGDFVDFTMGATLELMGAGSVYLESDFTGDITIDITF